MLMSRSLELGCFTQLDYDIECIVVGRLLFHIYYEVLLDKLI